MKKGFTLLEIIIVIIIIGVLASVALPKLFDVIEYSRSAEVFSMIASIRSSVERCYLMNAHYGSCADWDAIDLESFDSIPGSHFRYWIGGCHMFNMGGYCILAGRNTLHGGSSEDGILMRWDASGRLYFCGYGKFKQATDNNGQCPGPEIIDVLFD